MISRKRKCLSISEKVEIIKEVESGVKNVDVCKKFGLSSSTVSTLLKNKQLYISSFQNNITSAKKIRSCQLSNLDNVLFEWFRIQSNFGLRIDGPTLKVQAERFARELGHENFTCSNGWIDRFKKRHQIMLGKVSWEHRAGDYSTGNDWVSDVWPSIRRDFIDEDIYNADETGLFYSLTPDETLKFAGEKCTDGDKSEVQLTVLVCANMTGTDKRKLLVIGKSENPLCFKNVKRLPVDYTVNERAWMTSDIFCQHLNIWNLELVKKKRKILLIVDSCPAHPDIENLTNIKLVFLPSNTTSILQPMDMGVIKRLKCYYNRRVIVELISQHEKKLGGTITLINALHFLYDAWEQVTTTTIVNCFIKSKLLTKEVLDEDELPLPVWVPTAEDFQSADDDLATCEISTKNNIVNLVEEKDEADDNEQDMSEPDPVPTLQDAENACSVLTRFFQGFTEGEKGVSSALSLIQSKLHEYKLESIKEKLF